MSDNKIHTTKPTGSSSAENPPTAKKGGSIEIRSGEVRDILGGVPSRLVRYGSALLFGVVLALLVFTIIFKYPTVLSSSIVVTNENPPATLVARATGIIDTLFVIDNQKVNENQLIAIIENPAEYNDVLKLKKQLDTIHVDFDSLQKIHTFEFNTSLQLGDIQENYSAFLKKLADIKVFIRQNYHFKLDESLRNQLKVARQLYNIMYEQSQAINEDYELKKRNVERQQKLIAREIISSLEFEKTQSEMLLKKSELDAIRSELAQKQININELEQKIIENNQQYIDNKNKLESELLEAFNNLRSEIYQWELSYVFRSPLAGTITFNRYYSENQNIREGDKAFNVVPHSPGEFIGKVSLPLKGSGKVKQNQQVNVKFDNYPYVEFGLVKGKVKNVSLVPEDNFYTVEVVFPDGLVTNYNKPLEMQNELAGKAEIIAEDMRLIQRIFNPIRSVWKERVKR